ncbi:MAG: 2-phosphosulfolactate phosphatase [Dehalococcoidia bacterium]|nr:2-phosphosulfolactate phosphatase [Dehalococcoidia bacterium]
MKVDVAFLPRLVREPEATACVVVDVLRASSSIVVLLARGVEEIAVAASPAEARRMARQQRGRYLLCGELEGLTPPGFDHGNSPSEFDALDLRGQHVALSTTNGTKALRRLRASPAVIVGALLNATAAAQTLLAEAEARGLDATIVCAGLSGGKRLSLEDSFTAGALVEKAVAAGERAGIEVDLTDGARIAIRLLRHYGGDALAAFHESEHGRKLIGLGFERDLAFCAQTDRFDVVPRLEGEGLRLALGNVRFS